MITTHFKKGIGLAEQTAKNIIEQFKVIGKDGSTLLILGRELEARKGGREMRAWEIRMK